MPVRKPLNVKSHLWLTSLLAVVGICLWAGSAKSADVTPRALADAFAKAGSAVNLRQSLAQHADDQRPSVASSIVAQAAGSATSPGGWDIEKEFQKELHRIKPDAATTSNVSPQAIAAALSKDPGFLPVTPEFSSYHRGEAEPVSLGDLKAGVIADFVVAFDYKTPDPTSGGTYRIFRDRDSAQRFYDKWSIVNVPGFLSPGGNSSSPVWSSTRAIKNPEKVGLKEVKCETYLDVHANQALTTRCAGLHSNAPVLIVGLRVQSKPGVPSGNSVTRTVAKEEVNASENIAIEIVLAGIERVSVEQALLAGASSR